jgi:aminoglycoside N3'-acetyltransferase
VLVHSSLKALGYVEGGPATVVEALVDVFVEQNAGSVMLPTYSIDGTMHTTLLTGAVFDVRTTPSNLGAIPEAFRRHSDAVRSIHPTHFLAAIGPDARWLVEEHHTCGTSFGTGSPMAKTLDRHSYLLGLGTNLGNVTYYHCLEEIEPNFPVNVFTADSPISVECRDYEGRLHRLDIRAHDRSVSRTRIDRPENASIRNFFTRWFEGHGDLQWFQVGEAKCWLIRVDSMYGEAKRLMERGITIYATTSEIESFERRDIPHDSSAREQDAG